MSKTSISTNEELRKGEYLLSTNGKFKAEFTGDGNLAIFTWNPIWSTNTAGSKADRIVLEKNSNLAMYTSDNQIIWLSDTHSNTTSDRMHLAITNDGKLVLDRDGVTLWSKPEPFPFLPPLGPAGQNNLLLQ
uniref:Bulb-type lectin domain-containing protein n=1 Tax=Sphaeramia orbicularis TaxID=375764 RepID=A0A672YGJ7_9TELE